MSTAARRLRSPAPLVLAWIFLASATPARGEIRRSEAALLSFKDIIPAERTREPEPSLEGDPRPGAIWVAAGKIVVGNIALWVVDRYVFDYEFSHISWQSIKDNFKSGFIWDPDTLSTSFLGHAFHGGAYFNAARALGLSFWACLPYNAFGYLTWGFFLENDRASTNDLIMSTLGGVNTGEMQWRFSSQVLDDTATGLERVGREALAFLINPSRGITRLLSGGMFRRREENRELRAPMKGNFTLGGMAVSDERSLRRSHAGVGVMADIVYGIGPGTIGQGQPFDIIFVHGDVRYARKTFRLQFSTYGPWLGKAWGLVGGPQHFIGLFQHYDFLDTEALQMGGTSTTAGLVSVFPLGRGSELRTSLQAGGLLLGGIKNEYVDVGKRTYNYGSGAVGKVEARLSRPGWGALNLRFSYFRFFTLERTSPRDADESRDTLILFDAQYSLPLSRTWGVTLDYGRYARRQSFGGHPDARGDSTRLGAALEFRF